MTFLKKIEAIERIDRLIRRKSTGTAKELAIKLGISRSTVFEILNCMKVLGAEIKFNDQRKSYYYINEKELNLGFISKIKYL